MQENFSHTTTSLGSQVRTIGWINDLSYFHHLVSLSLSDNQLDQFPVSLCAVKTLQVRGGPGAHFSPLPRTVIRGSQERDWMVTYRRMACLLFVEWYMYKVFDFQELDVSRNRIKVIPQEIQHLSRYIQIILFVKSSPFLSPSPPPSLSHQSHYLPAPLQPPHLPPTRVGGLEAAVDLGHCLQQVHRTPSTAEGAPLPLHPNYLREYHIVSHKESL